MSQAWWIDWVCRSHALEVALYDYPGHDRAYVHRAAKLANEITETLEKMEAAYDQLPDAATAWNTPNSADE